MNGPVPQTPPPQLEQRRRRRGPDRADAELRLRLPSKTKAALGFIAAQMGLGMSAVVLREIEELIDRVIAERILDGALPRHLRRD